jgi:hypothetical protein
MKGGSLVLAAGLAAIPIPAHCGHPLAQTCIASPDGMVRFRLLSGEGRLGFAVSSRTNVVLEHSTMEFTVDGVNLIEGVEVGRPERYRVNGTYAWLGAHARATNHCNGAKLALKHPKNGTAYALDIRAFPAPGPATLLQGIAIKLG